MLNNFYPLYAPLRTTSITITSSTLLSYFRAQLPPNHGLTLIVSVAMASTPPHPALPSRDNPNPTWWSSNVTNVITQSVSQEIDCSQHLPDQQPHSTSPPSPDNGFVNPDTDSNSANSSDTYLDNIGPVSEEKNNNQQGDGRCVWDNNSQALADKAC